MLVTEGAVPDVPYRPALGRPYALFLAQGRAGVDSLLDRIVHRLYVIAPHISFFRPASPVSVPLSMPPTTPPLATAS